MRMEAQSARFEAGQVYLPEQAPWLATFLHEMLGFPKGRHDDQVDSVSQLLNWAETMHSRESRYLEYIAATYGGRSLVLELPGGGVCIG
jgi:phage terminase large subunit-like protein